jgi:polar amino acid transport system substrate-binding protein
VRPPDAGPSSFGLEEEMKKSLRLTALASIAVLMVAACGAGASPTPSPTAAPSEAPSMAPSEAPSAAPSIDPNGLLGKIIAAGKIRVSTDPNYAPFSFYDPATGKYTGFDNATAEEVVKRMNQELGTNLQLQWETPSWDLITAGSWGGRWDISIGSMSVTIGREKVVDFTDPYYYDYGSIAVGSDNTTITSVKDLDGKNICVGASTTYEQWLKGTLEIPDPNMAPPPANANITSLPTDNECLQAQAAGRKFDAIVANENSLANGVKEGIPIKILDVPPPFIVQVAFALDKSGPPTADMLTVLNKIVADMHADGTLSALSNQYLGKDVTLKP